MLYHVTRNSTLVTYNYIHVYILMVHTTQSRISDMVINVGKISLKNHSFDWNSDKRTWSDNVTSLSITSLSMNDISFEKKNVILLR